MRVTNWARLNPSLRLLRAPSNKRSKGNERCGGRTRNSGLIIILAALAPAFFAATPARAQERVRVALSVRNVVFLPFYYAKDTRIYDKHGLNVELIQMRSDLQLAGLVSGEIDFTPSVGPAGAAIANSLPGESPGDSLSRAAVLVGQSPRRDDYERVGRKEGGRFAHRFGKPSLRLVDARKRRRRSEEGDVYTNRQHDDQSRGDPAGNGQCRGFEPAVHRHDGGKGLQDSWRAAVPWRKRRGSGWSPIARRSTSNRSRRAICCAPCATWWRPCGGTAAR